MSNGPIAAFHASKHIMDDEWKRHTLIVTLYDSKAVDRWLIENQYLDMDIIYTEYVMHNDYVHDSVLYILECTDSVLYRMLDEIDVRFAKNT